MLFVLTAWLRLQQQQQHLLHLFAHYLSGDHLAHHLNVASLHIQLFLKTPFVLRPIDLRMFEAILRGEHRAGGLQEPWQDSRREQLLPRRP